MFVRRNQGEVQRTEPGSFGPKTRLATKIAIVLVILGGLGLLGYGLYSNDTSRDFFVNAYHTVSENLLETLVGTAATAAVIALGCALYQGYGYYSINKIVNKPREYYSY